MAYPNGSGAAHRTVGRTGQDWAASGAAITGHHHMTEDTYRFTSEFSPTGYDQWKAEAEKTLKGAPFEKRLLHKTYDGITVQPIYTRQDWPASGDPSGFPGLEPFTRGSKAQGNLPEGWDIRQEHAEPDPAAANRTIMAELQRGVTSALVRLDAAGRAGLDGDADAAAQLAGRDGVMVYSADDLETVLGGVFLEAAPVALEAGAQFLPAAAMLAAVWRKRGLAPDSVLGAFNADPIGTLAATGALPVTVEQALRDLADLAVHTAKTWPQVTAVKVDTAPYHGGGASEAQDLACALATAVTYLRALTAAGLDIDAACKQITFTLAVECDFFEAIAKLRAARKLWARVAEASGASEPARAMRIHARTADRMMSKRDPWVNMLRTTVAGFASAVGGAEAVTTQPFDAALGLPDGLSRRVARNTQIVLNEESSLSRVVDPAGGSWYIETLTDQLARAAWTQFQEIERGGGIVAALAGGTVKSAIEATWAERLKNLAKRKDPVTGVSEFPNIHEKTVSHPAPDYGALRQAAAARLSELCGKSGGSAALAAVAPLRTAGEPGTLTEALVNAAASGATLGGMARALAGEGTKVAAMPRHRLAEPFEALRDASDAYRDRTGARPRIFLINIGPIAHHTGRATFAKNFFETGGIEALGNNGFSDPAVAVAAFKESGAKVAILCSSDKLYEELAVPFAQAFKAAGCEYLFLAGAPGDKKEAYQAAGIDNFIFMGGDVLGTVGATLGRLGAI